MTISKILTTHNITIWNGYVLDESSTGTTLKPLSDFKTANQVLIWLGY